MKRNFAMVVTVVMFVAVMLALSSRQARADGAVVIQNTACAVLDATCNNVFVITDVGTTFLQTPNGNSKASCQGTLPAGAVLPTGGAVHCTDFLCGTLFGVSSEGTETISPTGQVNVQCPVKQ